MRLVADGGLWRTDSPEPAMLVAAVVEISGAVVAWEVDVAAGPPTLTFTDVRRADWLWRAVGESGHVALGEAAVWAPSMESAQVIDLADVDVNPDSIAPLRRLAVGHWLRRWWPASARDGIMALDAALLDAEIALLTAAAEEFFTDDTLDSDAAELLAPHAAALTAQLAGGDPRVEELLRRCADLADDLGLNAPGWPELITVLRDSPPELPGVIGVRSEYALAAGPRTVAPGAGVVTRGVASLRWAGVPARIFDAAEGTISWSIVVTGAEPFAAVAVDVVTVATTDSAAQIPVRLQCGSAAAAGVLDDAGRAVLPLIAAGGLSMTESAAWEQDWSATTVTVGAEVDETTEFRDRVRDFARARLARPADDAYLAEILAAESDY